MRTLLILLIQFKIDYVLIGIIIFMSLLLMIISARGEKKDSRLNGGALFVGIFVLFFISWFLWAARDNLISREFHENIAKAGSNIVFHAGGKKLELQGNSNSANSLLKILRESPDRYSKNSHPIERWELSVDGMKGTLIVQKDSYNPTYFWLSIRDEDRYGNRECSIKRFDSSELARLLKAVKAPSINVDPYK